MIDQELTDYIMAAQKHGLPELQIKQNLLAAGWDAAMVEENFVHSKVLENQRQPAQGHSGQSSPVFAPAVFTSPNSQPPDSAGPALGLSGNNPQRPASGKSFFKRPLFWLIAAVIIIASGSAYGYYAYAYMTPAKALQNLTAVKSSYPKTVQDAYSFSYTDNSLPGENLSASVNGTSSVDSSSAANLKVSNNAQVNVGAYGFSYNIPVDELIIGNAFYINLGKIDQLKPFLAGQNIEWVKLDLNQLQQYIGQQSASGANKFSQAIINNPQLKAGLAKIWSGGNFLSPGTFFARESINGTAVYHIKPVINTAEIIPALESSLQLINSAEGSSSPVTFTPDDNKILTAVVNKFQVKSLDLWVGQKDSLLYKVSLVMNAPGAADFASSSAIASAGPLGAAQSKSRDALRLNDIRQIQTALQLYHSDFGGYPQSLNGQPQNMQSGGYLASFPTAPEPADGACTDYFNGYWYKAAGKPKVVKDQNVYPSYTLTFCLGADTGGYKAGIGMVTPGGIEGDIACPATPDKCVGNSTIDSSSQDQAIINAVNKMTFSGQLSVNVTYSDYGKPANIQAPASSTDLMSLIKQAIPSFGSASSSAPQATLQMNGGNAGQ